MLKKIFAAALFLFLASCETSTTGVLTIDQTFKVNATVKGGGVIGDPNGGAHIEVKNLNAGTYKGTLTAKGSNELWLSVGANNSLELSIHVPDNNPIPSENGNFTLSAEQSRQTFDMAGTVATKKTDSETRRGYEDCWVTRHEQVCGPTGNHGYECHDQVVQYPGQKDVEYFVRTIDKNVEVDLLQTHSSTKLGHFSGSSKDSERHYLYEGYCR